MNTKDSKEEFHYFNDEWNKKKLYVNGHMLDVINKEVKKEKTIKNDKPDGRRYKK